MKTRFTNDDYKRTHGKSPKGTGLWTFSCTAVASRGYTDIGNLSHNGTLTEARKAIASRAKAVARDIGGVSEILIDTLG